MWGKDLAVKRCKSSIDVVKAAQIRIMNVFSNRLPVYMSFSGGKDSLTLADIVFRLIQDNKINPNQLTVQFIDEEAIFACIEQTVIDWRKKFILAGVKFEWFCLEVKHFSCFNKLSNDESFICWDSTKKDVWVRQMPKFALKSHKLLKPRKDTYQDFLIRHCSNGITMTGVRASESIQRLINISKSTKSRRNITSTKQILPLYDWTDKDIWLYLKNNKVKIPDIYLYLWQSGSNRKQLRVSQFFSVDTARSLIKLNEYYPNLMDRIIKREPNAYLASLYWDSEMFGRNSYNRRKIEDEKPIQWYKDKLTEVLGNIDLYFNTQREKEVARTYKKFLIANTMLFKEETYKKAYELLMSGDPKLRSFRSLRQRVYTDYIKDSNAKESKKVE